MKQTIEPCDKTPHGIIDSHAHYFDSRFDESEESAEEILRTRVFGEGIEAVINVATRPENALRCIKQAKGFSRMFVAAGIHPEDAQALGGSADEEISKLRELIDTPEKRREAKIVALGEIGLDYYWQPCDKERQWEFFEKQMLLAGELDLPVVIHDREAHGDCFEMILRHPEVRGVFHSFSGSAEMAKELCRRGWYLSFSGVLTFKNARKAREAAAVVPRDRVLLETDAPYLTPEPFRGRLNHSGYLVYTAKTLSEIWDVPYEQAVRETAENTKRLFGLPIHIEKK